MISVAPICEQTTAVALPMPEDAPVTNTDFPTNKNGFGITNSYYNKGH